MEYDIDLVNLTDDELIESLEESSKGLYDLINFYDVYTEATETEIESSKKAFMDRWKYDSNEKTIECENRKFLFNINPTREDLVGTSDSPAFVDQNHGKPIIGVSRIFWSYIPDVQDALLLHEIGHVVCQMSPRPFPKSIKEFVARIKRMIQRLVAKIRTMKYRKGMHGKPFDEIEADMFAAQRIGPESVKKALGTVLSANMNDPYTREIVQKKIDQLCTDANVRAMYRKHPSRDKLAYDQFKAEFTARVTRAVLDEMSQYMKNHNADYKQRIRLLDDKKVFNSKYFRKEAGDVEMNDQSIVYESRGLVHIRDGYFVDLPEDIQTTVMNIHKLIVSEVRALVDSNDYKDIKDSQWAMSCIDEFLVAPTAKGTIGSIRAYKSGKSYKCMIQATGHFRNHEYGWIEELLHEVIKRAYVNIKPKIRKYYNFTITNEGSKGEPFEGYDVYPPAKRAQEIWDRLDDRKVKSIKESPDNDHEDIDAYRNKALNDYIHDITSPITSELESVCDQNPDLKRAIDLSISSLRPDNYRGFDHTVTLCSWDTGNADLAAINGANKLIERIIQISKNKFQELQLPGEITIDTEQYTDAHHNGTMCSEGEAIWHLKIDDIYAHAAKRGVTLAPLASYKNDDNEVAVIKKRLSEIKPKLMQSERMIEREWNNYLKRVKDFLISTFDSVKETIQIPDIVKPIFSFEPDQGPIDHTLTICKWDLIANSNIENVMSQVQSEYNTALIQNKILGTIEVRFAGNIPPSMMNYYRTHNIQVPGGRMIYTVDYRILYTSNIGKDEANIHRDWLPQVLREEIPRYEQLRDAYRKYDFRLMEFEHRVNEAYVNSMNEDMYQKYFESIGTDHSSNTSMGEAETKRTLGTLSAEIINNPGKGVTQYTANTYANIITKNLLPIWAHGYQKLVITLDSYQSDNTLEFKAPKMTQDFVSRFIAGRETINGLLHQNPEIRIKMSPKIFQTMTNRDDAYFFFRSAIKYYDSRIEKYAESLASEAMKLSRELKHLVSTTKLSGIVVYPMSLLFKFNDVSMTNRNTFDIKKDDIKAINNFVKNISAHYSAPEKEKKAIVDDIRKMVQAMNESFPGGENNPDLKYLSEEVSNLYNDKYKSSMESFRESQLAEELDRDWSRNTVGNVKVLTEKFGVKKLKKIPADLVSYIIIEAESIKDANDKMMISSYCLSKIEIVEWYIELLEVGSKKYIVPHTKPYLEGIRTQLLAAHKKIMDTSIPKADRPLIDIKYPKGYEG